MSKKLSSLIIGFARLVTLPTSDRQRSKVYSHVTDYFDRSSVQRVQTKHGDLKFYSNRGAAAASAVHTFHYDEPETIAWIDDYIQPDDVVWDVGANIGLFSCYAAISGARVVAFEPSGLNFGLLVEHVELNSLDQRIDPYCLALSDANEATSLFASTFEGGHGFSSVGKAEIQCSAFETRFRQAILAFTADELVARMKLPRPDHLKIDVDGNEPLILEGAQEVLKTAKTVIIEIEGKNEACFDTKIRPMLEGCGLSGAATGFEPSRNRLFTRL